MANGNLEFTLGSSQVVRSTINAPSSSRIYFEVTNTGSLEFPLKLGNEGITTANIPAGKMGRVLLDYINNEINIIIDGVENKTSIVSADETLSIKVTKTDSSGTFNFGQQPFVYGDHDLAAGTVVIDGETYGTLYQELEGYQVAGGYFYDEKNQEAVRGSDLRKRFGRDTAIPELGIYDLTETPNYAVSGYEKTGELYKPLRDYTPELKSTEQELQSTEQELQSTEQELHEVRRELIVTKAALKVEAAKNKAKD